MKSTKIINLLFKNGEQTATTYINTTFPVHKIIVRQVGNTVEYVGTGCSFITSDITDGNQPLALLKNNVLNPLTSPQTEYTFLNPINISGSYTFTLSAPPANGGSDNVFLLLEFQE